MICPAIGEMLAAQKTEAERFEAREKEHAAELGALRARTRVAGAKELYALRVAELESLHTQDQESLRDLECLQYLQALPERVAELERPCSRGRLRRATEAAVPLSSGKSKISSKNCDPSTAIGDQQQQIGDSSGSWRVSSAGRRLNAELVECYQIVPRRTDRRHATIVELANRLRQTKPARAARKLRRRSA